MRAMLHAAGSVSPNALPFVTLDRPCPRLPGLLEDFRCALYSP